MYTKFYALKEKPFNLTPDPRFLYLSESHKEALASFKYGLLEKKGFIVLTGEVGTGKTTLLNAFINELNTNVKTIVINNPNLTSSDFFKILNLELGLPHTESKSTFIFNFKNILQNAIEEGTIYILIIDEAQNLSNELLEEVRLLSNLEIPTAKLLQIFLVGQNELNDKLNMVNLRQLKQRISIRYTIHPLNLKETKNYIYHRLNLASIAGINRRKLFSKRAVNTIFNYSKGLPRLINVLCDNALLTGYVKRKDTIHASIIKEVIWDIEKSYVIPKEKNIFAKMFNAIIILLIVTATALLGFWGWHFLKVYLGH